MPPKAECAAASRLRVVPDAVEQYAAAVITDGEEPAPRGEVEGEGVANGRPLRGPVGEGRARSRVDNLEGITLLVGGYR